MCCFEWLFGRSNKKEDTARPGTPEAGSTEMKYTFHASKDPKKMRRDFEARCEHDIWAERLGLEDQTYPSGPSRHGRAGGNAFSGWGDLHLGDG